VTFYRPCAALTQTGEKCPWNLTRLNKNGPAHRGLLGLFEYTYRTEASGSGVTVYVLDTGINVDHEEFEGRASIGSFRPQSTRATGWSPSDIIGHGTHVAGTIGGKNYGVAKNVNLISVKVFPDVRAGQVEHVEARSDDIIAALNWVKEDVNSTEPKKRAVVNISIESKPDSFLDVAIADTVRQGIVVVVAAGNANSKMPYS